MFFFNPTPTPYDLNWRMFGIPVRVHPTFWLLAAVMGWDYMSISIGMVLLWIACMFVSILVHELGHVFMARLFCEPSQIVLYGLGGLAMGQYQNAPRWQRILILLAGPGAGLALYGVARLVYSQVDLEVLGLDRGRFVFFLFHFLFFMNLVWSVLNLLPVQPLDGGQITRELCLAVSRRKGLQFSFGLSFLCAGLIALYSAIVIVRQELWYPEIHPKFAVIMFAVLAVYSYMMMQQATAERRHWDLDEHWR